MEEDDIENLEVCEYFQKIMLFVTGVGDKHPASFRQRLSCAKKQCPTPRDMRFIGPGQSPTEEKLVNDWVLTVAALLF